MSNRSRAGWQLAMALSEAVKVPCTIEYHGQRKDSWGGWHVAWCDGPTLKLMDETIERVRPRFAAFAGVKLWCDRSGRDASEAAALLTYLEAHPERLGEELYSWMREASWDEIDYPERLPELTLERARALCTLDPALNGMMSSATERALRERGLRGWDAVAEWLDGIVAARKDPEVTQLADVRRRRAADRAAGGRQ